MRKSVSKEAKRIKFGAMASKDSDGFMGAFEVTTDKGVVLTVVVSDGSDWRDCGLPGKPWEHVSVSTLSRCPTWEEMDFVKRMFWRDDETVLQFHVPRSEHISYHNYCLHLWKPPYEVQLPPSQTVAPEGVR